MNDKDLGERFLAASDEYLKFDRVENKRSTRPDLHAFLMLAERFDSDRDLITAAEHDEYWLDVPQQVLDELTLDDVVELTRCGISYSEEYEALFSFT